ncbi:MAG: MCE family protein [Deltaproteobacteria bacterium]|nr:MAG: MCE family protein [Deltaproteobacteria bacterium]TMB37945.1 MAG: MCE family protein [Deltaproteobacteria bacterium]
MQSFWTPLRVGLVVALAVAAFGFGLYLIGAEKFGANRTYNVYAVFDDATGLGVRSRVQIAGIPIGQVDRVELDQQLSKAKVWLRVRRQFVLHRNATITKRSESILGDFLLDVGPGTPDQPQLQDGDEIRIVIRQPSMNDVFQSLNKIAGDISDITGNLRKVLGGTEGEDNMRTLVSRLLRISEGIERIINQSGAKLDATLANFQRFSGDLAELSSSESGDIVAILQNTRDATREARDILKTIGQVVGSNQQQGDFKESVKSLKSNLAKLDASLTNFQEITDKINKGQGTVGHLINDDKLAKNLDRASSSLTNLLGGAERLKIEVNWRSELFIGAPGGGTIDNPTNLAGITANTAYNPWTKNYFGLRIIPRPDKWYGLEIVDDPRGLTRRVETTNTANCGTLVCYPNYPDRVITTTTERQLKFSAYMAKRYGPFSGRFGILENTGGIGLKLHLLNDALTLSADAFEFANPLKDHPRVKVYLDYRFLDHLLITAGADDLVNPPRVETPDVTRIVSGRDFFLGAGLYFTDEDISKLVGLATSRF